MTDAVLAAGEAHNLVRRNGINVKASFIVIADGLQHLRQIAQAVLPVVVVTCGVNQRLLEVVSRGKIRRSDAQVERMAALGLQRNLFIVECSENFGPEQVQTM